MASITERKRKKQTNKQKPAQCCAYASKAQNTSGDFFFATEKEFLVLHGASAKDNASQGAKHSANWSPSKWSVTENVNGGI